MNKKERLQAIRDLVLRQSVDTQEEIVDHLKQLGVRATQATVSRDIKELGIIKVPSETGYIYGLPKSGKTKSVTRNVLTVTCMDNMMSIQVTPGSTMVLKRQISERFASDIFSIVADDDTILLILRTADSLPHLEQTIKGW